MPIDQPTADAQAVRFPRLYKAIKWFIVGTLTLLALIATVFWTMVLGGFAASGFHARDRSTATGQDIAVTAECAWPYSVQEQEAYAVCRMFYNLSPEERAKVLKARK